MVNEKSLYDCYPVACSWASAPPGWRTTGCERVSRGSSEVPNGDGRGREIAIRSARRSSERHVKILNMPAESVPAGLVHDVAEVEGRVAVQPIVAGEILMGALRGPRAAARWPHSWREHARRHRPGQRRDRGGGFPAARQPRRRRRPAVKANPPRHGRDDPDDLKVLAVDQTAATDKNEPVVVRAVTLEISRRRPKPGQGEEEGTIQLALRNPLETAVAQEEPPPAPAPVVVPAPRPRASPRARDRDTRHRRATTPR